MKIKIYEIALLTGDLTKPLHRVSRSSLHEVRKYIEQHENSPEQDCSVITRTINQKGTPLLTEVFFGTTKRFLNQEYSKSTMVLNFPRYTNFLTQRYSLINQSVLYINTS